MAIEQTDPIPAAPGDTANRHRYAILLICFLIILLDGLDTTSIAFVVPALAGEWGLPPSALTSAFVATSLGAVVGYMLSGKSVARLSLRTSGALMVLLFGLGTLATAFVGTPTMIAVMRFVSAIGLGGVLPLAIGAATGAFPSRNRETVTMIVASGISAGGVMGGLLGGPLMAAYGWGAIFILGGVLPIVVLPLFLWALSRTGAGQTTDKTAGAIGQLFEGPLAARTGLLWGFAFLVFLVTYSLTFWIPTLVLELGFERQHAPLAAAAFGMGGLVGNLVVMSLVSRLGITSLLLMTTSFAVVFIVALSQIGLQSGATFLLIGALGAMLITGCVGQTALAVLQYQPQARITGIGWASAFGRMGAIVGPAVGGILLAAGMPAQTIILTAIAPALVAVALLMLIRTAAMRAIVPSISPAQR